MPSQVLPARMPCPHYFFLRKPTFSILAYPIFGLRKQGLTGKAIMARREQYDDEMVDAEQPQRVRSTVSSVRKQKGRGFRERMDTEDPKNGTRGSYDTLETGSGPGPAKCKFSIYLQLMLWQQSAPG